jgi:hypothetical protein
MQTVPCAYRGGIFTKYWEINMYGENRKNDIRKHTKVEHYKNIFLKIKDKVIQTCYINKVHLRAQTMKMANKSPLGRQRTPWIYQMGKDI